MQSKASTVEEYLTGLPEDRREAIEAVRRVVLENLDTDYEEGMHKDRQSAEPSRHSVH